MAEPSAPPPSFPFALPSLASHPAMNRPAVPQSQDPAAPPSDVATLQSELLQSRAQRKMLVKELKFVREQLAYHRKQLARVEADKAEMAHDLHQLKLRVAQAEEDKTKVMTRSVAEKHMLANEINALEDTFMAGITGTKQSALEQSQAQVVMLRKEVRYLRTQFVGVRQELARERKNFEDQLASRESDLQSALAKLQESQQQQQQQQQQPSSESSDRPPSPSPSPKQNGLRKSSHSEHQTGDSDNEGDDELDARRLKKQRDMFEKENVALTKQVSQLHTRVQQLECEIIKFSSRAQHAHGNNNNNNNSSNPSSPSSHTNTTPNHHHNGNTRQSSSSGGIGESVLHTQQDNVRMLKQMLDDAKREEHDLRETSEANLNVLRGTVKEVEDSLLRVANQNKALTSELDEKLQEVHALQEQLQEALMEKLMLEGESPLLNNVGRLSSSLASTAKDATSKALFKLQRQIG